MAQIMPIKHLHLQLGSCPRPYRKLILPSYPLLFKSIERNGEMRGGRDKREGKGTVGRWEQACQLLTVCDYTTG